MNLESPQKEMYAKERFTAIQAQRLAQEIAFGPIVFQVSRLMVKFGIFKMLDDAKNGLTMEEIADKANLSIYGAKVLLESSLTIGTILMRDDKFFLAKAGWFLLNDDMARVNMDFNHDVNYLGLFNLEEAILNGKPEGLKVFGTWPTVYEGLSQLPPQVQKSWFGFDHFYSDSSFQQALEIVFQRNTRTLLDVGGNTGRWALRCVAYNPEVNVTIMDLPQQLEMMRNFTKGQQGYERINGYGINLLDDAQQFPTDRHYDAIWMSQFLDCFGEDEIFSILSRAAKIMDENSRLYIMETFWDRQKYEPAAFCLTMTSLYFTAIANGNSKMYHSDDMERIVNKAGLKVERLHDGLGHGHSIMVCKKY